MAESITVEPKHHDKLGVVHCGVVRDGTVSCGGDIVTLEDGAEHLFERVNIKVRRSGSEYTFERA